MTSPLAQDLWLALAVGGFVMLVMVIAVLARREPRPAPSTDAKLDAIDRRLKTAEDKLATADHDLRNIRAVVGNLPTKESIHAIGEQVAESRGKIEGMQSTLHSQTRSLDRIEDFLMRAAGDAIIERKSGQGS